MKKIIVLVVFLVIISLIPLFNTFGLFESDYDIEVDSDLAKWEIDINDNNITGSSQEFVINNLAFSEDENVLNGKFAPSMEAYFDIIINPNNTEVSIRYDIELDFSSLSNSLITLKDIKEVNGSSLTKTGKDIYTGIITYNEITQSAIHDIKVTLIWNNNEENNQEDYETGSNANRNIEIPVKVNLSQYLEEEIEEYQ